MKAAFSIEIIPPLNWQQQFNVPPAVLYQFIAPQRQDNFSPNLNINKASVKASKQELKTPVEIGFYVEKVQVRIFPMYKVLEKRERKVGDYSGILIVISYAYGPLDLLAFQFAYRDGDDLVNVVYTCLLKDFSRLRPDFEKSLATLKGTDSTAATKP